MIRKTLATTALAAAIVAVPGVAMAHGVNDPSSTPYCGPGMTWSDGHCVNTHRHDINTGPDAGEWGVAGLALLSLLILI